MRHRLLRSLAVLLGALALPSAVQAGPDPMDVLLNMTDVNGTFPNARGLVAIKSDAIAADELRIMVTGLQANTTHVVMLAAARETGALPVQFAGEFTTDATGSGFFSALLEVVNAYSPANPGMTAANGRAPRLAGVLANGGFNVPLDFIRIYRAAPALGGAGTVFTLDGTSPGGLHVLSTQMPIPQESPSAQFLYNIVNSGSQKCVGITTPIPENDLNAVQMPCTPRTSNQSFRFIPTGLGTFHILVASSLKCLTIRGDLSDELTPAMQENCRGLRARGQQQFRLMPNGATGTFQLVAVHSTKCLDITGGSTQDNAVVMQSTCRPNVASQLFRLTRIDP